MTLPRSAVLATALAVCALPAVAPAAAGAQANSESPVERRHSREIGELVEDLEKSEEDVDRVLLPVSVLISVLALGGGLGIVFSIRDQRRVSQLHELTVAGEVSSQRRSEQSYASFLEQSQTTLSLVNDTLGLAKDATDRAAKSMVEKAQLRVDAIEERAQKLMLDVFNSREFELVVENPTHRAELHAIGDEVRALEGYLSLQDIELKPYTKFVKALDQFLRDDTESALRALQVASQDRIVGDLQKYVEYWLGYMLTTVGEYEEAVARFEHDEIDLPERSSQRFQLERIIAETRFFHLAKPVPDTESWSEGGIDPRTPHQRFEVVASLLDRLAELASEVDESDHHRAKAHTQMEIVRTRADVYEWVGYDPKHLDHPLPPDVVAAGREIVPDEPPLEKPSELIGSSLWKRDDPGLLRYWAFSQAQKICQRKGLPEQRAEVDFALAECYFKLRDDRAAKAFGKAEDALRREFGEHREKRREVALHQSLLICGCRLFTVRKEEEEQRRERREEEEERREAIGGSAGDAVYETPTDKVQQREKRERDIREILQAEQKTQEKLNDMRQGRVTVFSHIQRRNLTQEEFKKEVRAIVVQEEIGESEDR
jgi:tetratricopeptide (TPR) repeat protein